MTVNVSTILIRDQQQEFPSIILWKSQPHWRSGDHCS